MDNYVLKEVFTEDDNPLRVYITLLSDSMKILLFRQENAWKSNVPTKSLQYFAEEHKLTIDKYCLNLLEYIRTANSDIKYVFNTDEFIINRSLKGSLTVKYFTCKVKKTSYLEHAERIMDTFYLENLNLHEQVNVFKKRNEELNECKSQCELKLKQLVAQKKSEENEQFGQFLLILNEKKRRIQHLTELLEVFKKGRAIVNPEVKVGKHKRKNINSAPLKKETISESESDSDNSSNHQITTDDESVGKSESPTEENQPSTSTAFDFLEVDFAKSHALPKRAKLAKSEDSVVVVPQTSKAPSSPKTENVNSKQRPKSPGIDLSTQQLLDML